MKTLSLLVASLTIAAILQCGEKEKKAPSFTVSDHIDANAPCGELDQDVRKAIKDRIAEILKSDVVKDIQKQVDAAGKKETVDVQVFLVDLAELKKEITADKRDDLKPEDIFGMFDGYTYAPKDSKTIVKVKIFCKRNVEENLDTNPTRHGFDRVVVHELVHAKLLVLQAIGAELPFDDQSHEDDPPPSERPGDHNGKFSKEVDKLVEPLTK